MASPKPAEIAKSILVGRTGVTATVHRILSISIIYDQSGLFQAGVIGLGGFVDANADSVAGDSIKAALGPAPGQDILDWAKSVVLGDAKYAGGT